MQRTSRYIILGGIIGALLVGSLLVIFAVLNSQDVEFGSHPIGLPTLMALAILQIPFHLSIGAIFGESVYDGGQCFLICGLSGYGTTAFILMYAIIGAIIGKLFSVVTRRRKLLESSETTR